MQPTASMCYHLTIDFHNTFQAAHYGLLQTHYISHKIICVSSYADGREPCNIKVYYVTLKIGTFTVK